MIHFPSEKMPFGTLNVKTHREIELSKVGITKNCNDEDDDDAKYLRQQQ